MVSTEPRRLEPRLVSRSRERVAALPWPWSGRLQRGKLRIPAISDEILARPRLIARIDEHPRPLTLIVAPAGFGKTMLAAEWARAQPHAAWLTIDAADGSLLRFWAHLRAAVSTVVADFGVIVTEALEAPYRTSPRELGHLMADELLDAPAQVRLVIDDLHLIAASDVFEFLTGVLEFAPPALRLLITARGDPDLPLARYRLRGQVTELRGSDLLFTEAEAVTFMALTDNRDGDVEHAAAFWRRTGGWAAGLRLATIAAEAAPSRMATPRDSYGDCASLDMLLDEMLVGRSPAERNALMRAALPARFDSGVVAALVDGNDRSEVAREAIRFALAADLCRPASSGHPEWFEFHPLFREALLRRLTSEESVAMTALHARAAAWFAVTAVPDAAITHWLAAGEVETAVALVEREMQPAFDREDWPEIARWLALLPEETVDDRPHLLLARAWLAHLRGQFILIREVLQRLDARLARGDLDASALMAIRAEMALLQISLLVPLQNDPEGAVVVTQRATRGIPPRRRFPLGLAWSGLIMALQAAGRPGDAVAAAMHWTTATSERVDSGATRGLLALLFIQLQDGQLTSVEATGESLLTLAERYRLRLTAGWAHRFIAEARYERNDLRGAIDHFATVARDFEHFHLVGLREVFFRLALAYLAADQTDDAVRTVRRGREVILGAGSIEQLPVLDAYEAFVALRCGDAASALAWASATEIDIDSATLHVALHPALARATILAAVGDETDLATAARVLTELRERAARGHFVSALVRIDALAAVVSLKRGRSEDAAVALRRSLETGVRSGFNRTYLDLVPLFAPELRELAAHVALPVWLLAALPLATAPASAPPVAHQPLTEREREVLTALAQRLTYKEIADRLFISPLTVKRHASSIYGKLGVSGRGAAILAAENLGWLAAP